MKLYFLSRDEVVWAEPDPEFMGSLKAELLGHDDIQETRDLAEADALVLQEEWTFREWRHIDRLLAHPIIGKYPHKTFTINVDDAANGLLRGVYNNLDVARFVPALHANAPYLRKFNEVVSARVGQPRPAPAYLATWFGNPASNVLRREMVEMYRESKTLRVLSTSSWMVHGVDEKVQYADLLQAGKFSLCPAGWGPPTLRLYESMAAGVAPVIIADGIVLPRGPDWDKCSIVIAESDLPRLEQILTKHVDNYAEMGERAFQEWSKYFGPDRLVKYFADELLGCIQRSNPGAGSKAQEVARWRSRHMIWSNRWSIPQRIMVKLRRLLNPAPPPPP